MDILRKYWNKQTRNLKRRLGKINKPTQERKFKEAIGDEHIITIGSNAAELFKNPAFDACCKKIEQDLFYAWKTSAPKDEEAREKLYYRMEGLHTIIAKLNGMVNVMTYEAEKLKANNKK